ncbi:hypothetical protein BU17DRAFT_46973 [Hysterangium stoloniferum]|nr:hypothetical protein BU17DRAFT_46973 [Hysterangium stoloniferum]
MTKIPLYISNGHAYVWTVEDASELRSKHRICGTLSGTLPHLSQQNFFLGLPLLLMPEEVVLLVENGIAVMVDDATATREPSASDLREWDESRKQVVAEQIEQWQQRETARQALEMTNGQGKGRMSEDALQKRKERLERKAREEGAANTIDENLVISRPTPGPVLQPQSSYMVQIPSTSLSHSWYQPRRYDTLDSAKQAGIWQFPSTLEERASYHVFRDLWEKGHFLGSGIKFGGEFLVYPGDPLRYHSHFVASVLPSHSAEIRPMEIVAHGRLVTATKKSHLLCGWDEETGKVTYLSLEWSGFG